MLHPGMSAKELPIIYPMGASFTSQGRRYVPSAGSGSVAIAAGAPITQLLAAMAADYILHHLNVTVHYVLPAEFFDTTTAVSLNGDTSGEMHFSLSVSTLANQRFPLITTAKQMAFGTPGLIVAQNLQTPFPLANVTGAAGNLNLNFEPLNLLITMDTFLTYAYELLASTPA